MTVFAVTAIAVSGCSDKEPVADEFVPERKLHPVSVLFVDTPGVAEKVARQWAAERSGEINAKEISANELFENNYAAAAKMDVIVYPGQLTGHLVADEQLTLLPDDVWNSETLGSRGLLKHGRTTFATIGRHRYSIPLGSPQFFMMYRKDVLESWDAEVPDTWDGLKKLKFRLDARSKTGIGAESGITSTIMIPSVDGWAAKSFLAIAASEIRQRGKLDTLFDRRTMKPLISNEPFVSALSTLKRLSTYSRDLDPAAVTQAFLAGRTGIAISWPAKSFSAGDQNEKLDELIDKIAIGRLPGTKRNPDSSTVDSSDRENNETIRVEFIGFESRQAAILKSALQPMDVYRFLEWIGSKQTGSSIFADSKFGAPTRAAHLGNPRNWTGDVLDQAAADSYADQFLEVNEESVFFTFPRIRGTHRYIAELENSIQQFLADKIDATIALQQTGDAWEQITEEFGRKRQIELLRKDQKL